MKIGQDTFLFPFKDINTAKVSNLFKDCYTGFFNRQLGSVPILSGIGLLNSKQVPNFLIIIVFILLLFFFWYRTRSLRNSNRILRKKEIEAKEIARQKERLSLRNKNIEDSLNYAQRIQKAMLTTNKQFKSILPDSFILHKSKDIVSGDFYWISEEEDKVFVAAIDCTGHGVPGAFMSLIGFELFRKIIHTQKIQEAGSILDALNRNFNEIFGNEEDISLTDGMDLAFCVFNKRIRLLEFSGAFNPLYILRGNRLIEIKGDRFSVGADLFDSSKAKRKFTNHQLILEKDDMIYMFTDGYVDQFGGFEGKKFKYRRFRHLLLNIHKLPLEQQKAFLEETIENWKGNEEQIDDILIIGLKPLQLE